MSGQTHAFGYKVPGSPPAYTQIGAVAGALADHARSLGLTVVNLRLSRKPRSATRYLYLRDRQRREWFIRLSDHLQPRCAEPARPHFDLAMRDGDTGSELAFGFVARIARGEENWWPIKRDCARPRKGLQPAAKRARR